MTCRTGENNPARVAEQRANLVPAFASLLQLSPTVGGNALHHAWTLIEAFTALVGLVAAVAKFRAMRFHSNIRDLHTAEFPCPRYTSKGYSKAVFEAVKEVLGDMGYGEVAINVNDENNATAGAAVEPDYPSLMVDELV